MQLDKGWLAQQGADAGLLQAVDACLGDPLPDRLGIAVSGGGDSVALLHLVARWAAQTGLPVAAVTVDHGLRPESRAEAELVCDLCRDLGIPHNTLQWTRPDGAGNLPATARDGRYRLMAQWARAQGIGTIALGHTADDGAENFLMRVGRSAGLDGLAEMNSRFRRDGIGWIRPLVQQGRTDLRDYLRRHDVVWVEDPSNDDPRYARTRARRALRDLGDLGVNAQSIQHTTFALRQARHALAHYTREEARAHVQQDAGDLLIPQRIDPPIPDDIKRRIITAGLQWVGSSRYPPRKIYAQAFEDGLAQQQRLTVAGCVVFKQKDRFRITREHSAVKDLHCPTDAIWDSRWRLDGPHAPDLEVRALGEAVSDLPDWRKTGVPRRTLMASPAVWRGDSLLAVPLAGYNRDWSARIVADFASFLVSH